MTSDSSWLDSMPATYDQCLRTALFGPYAEHVAERLRGTAPRTLLEIAAGTGIVTRELVRALPRATITATDLNPAMVAHGAAQVPGAEWQVADAQQLPFGDEQFAALVCQFGVMFFPDRPAAFAEAARVLQPGGTYVFTTWDRIEHSELAAQIEAAIARVLPERPPDFMSRVPHGYADPDQVRRDVAGSGLEITGLERVVLRGHAESVAAMTRGFCLGSPLRFQLTELGDPADIAERAAAELTARYGAGPVDGSMAAFVVTAAKPGGPASK